MTDSAQPTEPEVARDSWTARAMIPCTERAPLTTRRLVSTLLVAWGYADQVELTELVASELASNAVRYAGDDGDLEVELSADDDVIRLAVADGSSSPPVLRPGAAGHRGGLGLQLVERVAIRWGVEDYLFGKRVWVLLPAHPRNAAASSGSH